MKIAVCLVTILYGFLSIVAPLSQVKDKEKRVPTFTMLCGGGLLVAAGVFKLLNLPGTVVIAVVGVLAVCVAAVMNGLKNGNVHIKHHVVRITISGLLIVGFLLW